MRTKKQMRAETKIKAIADYMELHGKIKNVDVLNGEPVRTNRLSAVIHTLKTEYGWDIKTKEKYTEDGKYIDCVYKVKNIPETYYA